MVVEKPAELLSVENMYNYLIGENSLRIILSNIIYSWLIVEKQ